ncbi:MAG: TolC family protein [Deltaproteobacteria bacterium]|nr:TolC family protein [Deltaproteobacteria bacterium]
MNKINSLSEIVILVFSIVILGCTMGKNYTYESIVTEHNLEHYEATQSTQTKSEPDLSYLKRPISVFDGIRIAIHNNPDIDIAISRIRQSEAIIDEANAAFWPSLAFYTEYLKADSPSTYLFRRIDQRRLASETNFNYPGRIENFEIGFSARWNIYNGGRDVLRKKMSETGLEINRLDRLTVENALIASVIQTYYSTLAAKDFIRIAKESVATVDNELRVMLVKYNAGGALKSDTLSLEVRLAQTMENLIRAQNNYKLTLAALANLMGADADTEIELSGGEWRPVELPADYDDGIVTAMGIRPELLKARKQIIQSSMALDMEKGGYLPRLDAQGRYYSDDPGLSYNGNRANWVAGGILNWDVFTGFSTGAKVRKARAVLDQMLAADRKTTQSVQLDVKTAYLRMSEAKARLSVAKASVAQAEESLNLVGIQYEGGSATITRYLDTELALNTARVRETSAFYDCKKAQADIGRSLGYCGLCARKELSGNGR